MGYLIQNIDIFKTTVTIPSADVQVMDSNAPFTLVTSNDLFIVLPIACFIKISNQNTPYSGWTHLHLTNTKNYVAGELTATYAANASTNGDLRMFLFYSMLCNFQSSPNRFGGLNGKKNLEIFFDVLPSAGDGDMEVTVFYTTLTF